MLTLILGKDWRGNRDEVLRRIALDVAEKQGGRVLIVPELTSHDMERRLCAAAGDTASRYAEVLSFTRLARRVADSAGAGAVECLDNGGRIAAMAAAARQLHSRLKAYAAVETQPEFLAELVDAVDEFKRCCITSKDLKVASAKTEGRFAQKLEELSLLLESYDSLCSRGKRDPRDQMTWLLEQLQDSDYGEKHIFYIDGFPDFTRQHLAILEHLIRVCPDVTVSLNCDRPGSHAMAFEKAGATAMELLRCSKRAGVEARILEAPALSAPLTSVKEILFQGNILPSPEADEYVHLRRVETVYQECTAAAEQIIALVQGGCRYRQIAVVCTDMAAYRDVCSLVFQRCGIPLYCAGNEEVLSQSVITAVLGAMEAALAGFDRRAVLEYLGSMLSPLDLPEYDRVENYAVMWAIRGSRWLSPWEWHPDGLDGIWTPEKKALLAELNKARRLAVEPLVRLRDGFAQAKNVADQVDAVYRFFEDIRLSEKLDGLARELDRAGDNRGAQILNQLWEILLTALEQLHDILGETFWDTDTFVRLFTLLLGQYRVGTIPPVLDAVTMGPVSGMRCQQSEHLIILGALEGSLPGYSGAKGVLTDQERTALREMGVTLTGGALEGLQAEFAEVYGVFCGAEKSVTLSCPAGQPSYIYRRLLTLTGREETRTDFLGAALTDHRAAGAYLARWDCPAEARSLGVEDGYIRAQGYRSYTMGAVAPARIRMLYGDTLRLSASQADRQAECRMSYFLKYGLRIKERKEATVDPAEFGTYVHAVLEQTARRVMELGGFHQVSLEDTLKLAEEFADAYAKERFDQLDSSRLQYLFQRNGQELNMIVEELWRELSTSQFAPVGFEIGFGDGKQMDAIPVGGHEMGAQLRGFVDRVDCWDGPDRRYFRVVDYKTGKKVIDYCDLFNGIGLQMLLYLYALEEVGQRVVGSGAVPAGVEYFPARVPVLTVDGQLSPQEIERCRGKSWMRDGLLLGEDQVLRAMEPEDAPKRLRCQRKDGVLTGEVASREDFKLLKAYIFRILGAMADEIASGRVDPNPYTRGTAHNACSFCPYGSICHKAQVTGRRNYKAMSPQRFWEQIRREAAENG